MKEAYVKKYNQSIHIIYHVFKRPKRTH